MEIFQLLPNFGNLAFTLGAFVVAILVIVAVHEFGHYIVGRWSGIDAEVFSLGFGPVLASRTDKRGTRWQIAAIPLGGYVRFVGDGDVASVTQAKDGAGNPREARMGLRKSPLRARAATVAAGPLFNFALSILLFAGLIMSRGVATEPLTIAELPKLPYETGLMAGDEIVAIAGQQTPALEEFGTFADGLPVAPSLDYEVRRDGELLTVPGPHPYPAIVIGISPDSAAADANLKVGDAILSVNGTPVNAFSELKSAVEAANGNTVNLSVWRDGQTLSYDLTPRKTDLPMPDGTYETRFLIGINGGIWFVPRTESPGILESLRIGVAQTAFIVEASVSGIYHVLAGDISTCNIRGPVGIAQTSGTLAAQGLATFISFIALLSTAVGMLNLFPIPVLDGGHLAFHAYEAITRKPPSDKVYNVIMTLGLALIVTMMVFGLSNDFLCP